MYCLLFECVELSRRLVDINKCVNTSHIFDVCIPSPSPCNYNYLYDLCERTGLDAHTSCAHVWNNCRWHTGLGTIPARARDAFDCVCVCWFYRFYTPHIVPVFQTCRHLTYEGNKAKRRVAITIGFNEMRKKSVTGRRSANDNRRLCIKAE